MLYGCVTLGKLPKLLKNDSLVAEISWFDDIFFKIDPKTSIFSWFYLIFTVLFNVLQPFFFKGPVGQRPPKITYSRWGTSTSATKKDSRKCVAQSQEQTLQNMEGNTWGSRMLLIRRVSRQWQPLKGLGNGSRSKGYSSFAFNSPAN